MHGNQVCVAIDISFHALEETDEDFIFEHTEVNCILREEILDIDDEWRSLEELEPARSNSKG